MKLTAPLRLVILMSILATAVVDAQSLDCLNDPVCYEWVTRYDGGSSSTDRAVGAVTSRDGTQLYVTGVSTSSAGGLDFATAAYNADTGAQIWATRYDSLNHGNDAPYGFGTGKVIAITPDSSMIFVTGRTANTNGKDEFLTIAYHAADGSQAWAAHYVTPDESQATSLALSADGKRLYVTGYSSLGPAPPPAPQVSNFDFGTIAYDAATGDQLWVARYDGPATFWDIPYGIGVANVPQPDGSRREQVFVTGRSNGASSDNSAADFATVAYDGLTGDQLWVARYDGPGHDRDLAYALGVSRDGASVFITGESAGVGTLSDYATICYDAVTGAQRWVMRYDNSDIDLPLGLAVSPTADRVAVTGFSVNQGAVIVSDRSVATIVYNATTGGQVWATRHGEVDGAAALAIEYSRDGRRIYVAGLENGNVIGVGGGPVGGQVGHSPALILAYDPTTGTEAWASHYFGPAGDEGNAGLAISPDGARVFVTGGGQGQDADFATLAYAGLPPLPVELKITSFRRLDNGHMLLEGVGAPSQLNTIEATPDLLTSFTYLTNVIPDSTGAFQFEDTDAGDFTKRFYRLAYP
jgi:hypothetical protein